ncbi:unnamed protein product [Effrenium voratum]|nr:unnamed protein product [Effrenium voratum]
MPHGYHGYWTKDLNKVNPAYGTEEDVRQLVILLHERKMKVIVDVNMNHAGSQKVNASNPRDVSILKPFNKPEHYHSDNCSLIHDADYERGSYFLERPRPQDTGRINCKLYGLPDFNHENPVVWQGLMQWLRDHVDQYGFDGIRVDAARHINRNFLNHIPETGPPIPAYYEDGKQIFKFPKVVNTDMAYVAGYATGDYGAVYNYPLYFVLKDIFVPGPKQKPMSALGDWMEKQLPKAEGRFLLNFLDNNDLPRFLYRIGEGGGVPEATMMALYHNAMLAMMGMEGLPALLFGSEQNARGRPSAGDLRVGRTEVDNWRQPLWHHGYNTSTPTFQLMKKVLWVRKRTNGLHAWKCIPVYMDHQVLVWARGPAIFAVSNAGQPSKIPSQRVLWDNATAGLGPYGTPSLVCNILDANPFNDCGVLVPGNISRLHLTGDPKLYVPKEYINEYVQSLKVKQKEGGSWGTGELSRVNLFTRNEARSRRSEAQKRVSRSWRPGTVTLPGGPEGMATLPGCGTTSRSFRQGLRPHLDKWGPPLGMPVPHVISGVLKDGCFHLGPGEKDGAVFALRNNRTFVLCPDSPEFCSRVIDDQVNLTALQKHSLTAGYFMKEFPILHLTFDVWLGSPDLTRASGGPLRKHRYGVYHMLISALPSIAPRLDRLRNGTMQLFVHAGHHFVGQILPLAQRREPQVRTVKAARSAEGNTADGFLRNPLRSVLGVETNVLRPPSDPPLKQAFHFCAPEIHFDLSTRPQYPRFEFSVPYLAEFRRNILATDDGLEESGRPCRLKRQGHIVVLSRGHSARALGNEDEMVLALKALGRPVEVVTPDPENFLHTLQSLSRAEVLVGAHGANMANMLFAPDGMKVVEIVPQVPFKMQDYHFWDLAAALNFTYMPIGDKVMPNEYDHQLALEGAGGKGGWQGLGRWASYSCSGC